MRFSSSDAADRCVHAIVISSLDALHLAGRRRAVVMSHRVLGLDGHFDLLRPASGWQGGSSSDTITAVCTMACRPLSGGATSGSAGTLGHKATWQHATRGLLRHVLRDPFRARQRFHAFTRQVALQSFGLRRDAAGVGEGESLVSRT